MPGCSFLSLSKSDSLVIKGLAIVVMLFHHYFGAFAVPRALVPDVFPFRSEVVGTGKACILLFAFVTGYGMCSKVFSSAEAPGWSQFGRSFLAFYKIYLLCFLLACVAMWLVPCPLIHCPSDWVSWVFSFTALSPSLGDWWYASAFAWMVLVMAPALALCRKWHGSVGKCLPVCLLALLPLALMFRVLPIMPGLDLLLTQCGALPPTIESMHDVLFFLPEVISWFVVGAALKGIEVSEFSSAKWRWVLAGVVALVLAWWLFQTRTTCLRVWVALGLLALAYVARGCMPARRCLMFLGQYAVWMWLNHRFIFGYWWVDFFYGIHPALAYVLLLVASLLLAMVTDGLFRGLGRLAARVTSRFGRRACSAERAC